MEFMIIEMIGQINQKFWSDYIYIYIYIIRLIGGQMNQFLEDHLCVAGSDIYKKHLYIYVM